MGTEVTLDRYAQIRAEMEAGALRDEALARAGLSAEDWAAAERGWLEDMGAEIARGRFELTHHYAEAFLQRQRALTKPAAPVVPPPRARVAEAPPAEAPALPRVEAKPTFLAAAAAPARPAVQRPNPLLAGTMAADVPAFREAVPFKQNATPGVPAPPAPSTAPRVNRAPAELAGTSMSFVAPLGPALPFARGAAPSPDRPSTPVTAPAAPPEVGPAAAPKPAVPVKRPPAALSGTSMGFVAPKGAALPFTRSAPPAPRTETGPAPAPRRAAKTDDGDSETLDVPVEELGGAAGGALPFALDEQARPPVPAPPAPAAAPGAPASPPALTLQQYASLCAELAVFRDRTEAIFHRYQLGNLRDRLTADLAWQERLRGNPAEYQAWQALYQRWVEHLEQTKKQGSDR